MLLNVKNLYISFIYRGIFLIPRIGLVYYFTFMILTIVYSKGFPILIMPIGDMQWRVEVGIFNATSKEKLFQEKVITVSCSCYLFR